MPLPERPSNFAILKAHDEQLTRLGMLAERYFAADPNTCLLKLRQLAELLAQQLASRVGLYTVADETQADLLRRLQMRGILPREVADLFHELRRLGNAANHQLAGDHRGALLALRIGWQLGVWFHRTFQDPAYKSGPFQPPSPPKDESAELKAELDSLRAELASFRSSHEQTARTLEEMQQQAAAAAGDRDFWEAMAAETEAAKAALEARLQALQAQAASTPPQAIQQLVTAASTAATRIQLSEADTRRLIDSQLAEAGWIVDTATLTYAKGARPEPGKAMAIAEWPTATGPSDYLLFLGLTPVAAVEAKRKAVDVSAALQQAKRYSRGFKPDPAHTPAGGPWGEFRLPFAFACNGRGYLRQLATQSGIWFCDLRAATNLGRPLDDWYTPDGLAALLKRDEARAQASLAAQRFDYGFPLRDYQQAAIRAVEAAIGAGRREILLAMATGTGKTKTCIALIYRLLKAQRFRRVLFLVDRTALGVQAADAFKDTRMEGLATFAEVFGLREIDAAAPERDTQVQIATVQGMVKRVLYPNADEVAPPVDQYDCIVVDECHRGYLLDRELSDTELGFRSHEDYVSSYRRVLERFDAVKIGLTATPALHTTQIFGTPVYSYGYREAVIDGFLVDHEPPVQIRTQLAEEGIVWRAGDQVAVYNADRQLELFTTPDEVRIDVDGFNRKVITESFNRVVCEALAAELDPAARQKTLIFCVTDAHADLVVRLLKEAFQARYGEVEDDAVIKITGAADQPMQLLRRYRNERQPSVAVTVDLLTTGIDVPEICNLVFLRRVNSRILYDQMLGRATRLCPEIGKEAFRIFDAVRLYEALKDVTAMQPVVVNPNLGFAQLCRELAQDRPDAERALARDQFLAKLQRKKRHLDDDARRDLEALTGQTLDACIATLRRLPLPELAHWFAARPTLGELLDRKSLGGAAVLVSEHPDRLLGLEHGYGAGRKPEDYLQSFAAYLEQNRNQLPALITVLTRPRELTRLQLRELAIALDQAGYTEARLATAWRELTNQDIAARIIGYIRKAAIGDALIPWEQRVDRALERLLAAQPWTKPQRDWLQRIARQTKANLIVDRAALDDPDLIFRREGGGFARLDKLFDGRLTAVLDTFHDALWPTAA